MEPSFTVCVCVTTWHIWEFERREKKNGKWMVILMMMRKWTFDFHYIDYIDNSLSCLPPIQDSIFIISLFLPRNKRSETLKMLSIGNKKKKTKNIHSFIQLESYEEKKTTTKTILWFIWDFHFKSPHFLTMMIIIIIMKMQYKMEDDE